MTLEQVAVIVLLAVAIVEWKLLQQLIALLTPRRRK